MAKIAGDWKQPLTKDEMDDIRRESRNERSVRAHFWESLKRVARTLPFAEDLVAAFYCATDGKTDIKVRATLFGALAYFILPFDVLPDLAPLIGFTDDAAVLALALRAVAGAITPEHRRKAKDKLAE